MNKLYKPYNNKIKKNNNINSIININSNVFNNRGNNLIDIYKENAAYSKKPPKIKLNPIKKTLLNVC